MAPPKGDISCSGGHGGKPAPGKKDVDDVRDKDPGFCGQLTAFRVKRQKLVQPPHVNGLPLVDGAVAI